jgi:para-aminobenzoate synthetase
LLRIALIDNYDSYTWNLYQLLWTVAGTRPEVIRNDEASASDLLSASFTHFVISPGPGTPAKQSDFGLCGELLRAVSVPCLGVCLGHQGIAHALGGNVQRAPQIMHGRISTIHHEGRSLFTGIPQGFRAVRYHSLAVVAPLPKQLRITAWASDGVIMGLEHSNRPLFGVQFHPESVETQFGERLIANFLAAFDGKWSEALSMPTVGRKARESGPRTRPGKPQLRVHSRRVKVSVPLEDLFDQVFRKSSHCFWLDSARTAYGMGRYSYMGAIDDACDMHIKYYVRGNRLVVVSGKNEDVRNQSIFDFLRADLSERRVDPREAPTPFSGGFVGYFGYGIKALTGIGGQAVTSAPDAEFVRVHRFLAIDHCSGSANLIFVGMTPTEASSWFDDMELKLSRVVACHQRSGSPAFPEMGTIRASVDEELYLKHFAKIQELLASGETYEACYTYQLSGLCELEPFAGYRRLRAISPAPYAAFLQFGDRCILSSSPERFVTVGPDGWAETKPIKGTAARHADRELDQKAKEELAHDEKTRSENLMIVDLLRNDLGRVCKAGTVEVRALMEVESYATVHQLVSTIRGQLREDIFAVDCLEATFPGGSMTGAPKKRTVELLDSLEPQPRGIYSGCLGFISYSGHLDQSIIIRTIVWEGSTVILGTGGAITAMSDARSEYLETRLKVKALLAALGTHEPRSSGQHRPSSRL